MSPEPLPEAASEAAMTDDDPSSSSPQENALPSQAQSANALAGNASTFRYVMRPLEGYA